MRRAALAIVGTITALVMLLSFKSHSSSTLATPPAAVGSTGGSTGTGTGTGTGTTGSGGSPAGTGTATQPTQPAARTGTFTGDAVDTRFGPVQVQISLKDGKLADVTALQYPTESRRDEEINAYAIPALTQEALTANGASIDMISGATFTSQGYISSLQSALDKAGS